MPTFKNWISSAHDAYKIYGPNAPSIVVTGPDEIKPYDRKKFASLCVTYIPQSRELSVYQLSYLGSGLRLQ